MLFILIAWIYISLLCWIWGYALISLFIRIAGNTQKLIPGFCIICFTGLSAIAVISGLLSLVMPLGNIAAQFVLLVPALLLVTQKKLRLALTESFNSMFAGYRFITGLLATCLLILLLILGASLINHPDSIGYHIQTIKWIEEYRVIPGLVHINTPLGYQGLWYCLCAIFSFKFLHTPAITFINTTVLVWYLLFLLHEINRWLPDKKNGRPGNTANAVLYLLLLAISCWSYVQVRLTATSVSPDFIAALYCWLIFYLLITSKSSGNNAVSYMLLSFLCCTAITIKLSTFPVCLVILYAVYQLALLKKRKAIIFLLVFALIILSPFVTRNIITSGYLFFPSPFPDIVQADWKLSKALTIAEKQYITSFARAQHQVITPGVRGAYNAPITRWLPVWWQLRALSDKLIVGLLLLLLLIALATAGRIVKKGDPPFIFSLLISVAGLVFWFLQAPDPRFGFGFIIPVEGILIYWCSARYINNFKDAKNWLLSVMTAFLIIIISYSLYRVKNYFNAQYLVAPAGAQKTNFRTIHCNGLTIVIPLEGGCGDAPLPCSYNEDCNHFSARGNSITDGFKEKK